MNRAKRLLNTLRLADSLYSTQHSRTLCIYNQVTQFSHLHPSLYTKPHTFTFLNTHQKLLFSSKPEPIIDRVLSNDWCNELESELFQSNPTLTHEIVTYILMKLDKHPQKASKFFNWVTEKSGLKPTSAMYSLILRIYASKESMKEFWNTIRKMKEHGCYIDQETYLTIRAKFLGSKMLSDATALTHFYNRMIKENNMDDVVKEVAQVIMQLDWGRMVEKKLKEMKISVSADFVLRVLRELRREPLKSLNFFKWVSEHSSYEHNTVTYNALLRVLGQEDSIGEFWSVMKEMKSVGHEMDLDTYVKISRQFQKSKMLKDAVELYELMMDGPFKPSVQDCSLLLRVIAVAINPNLDLVDKVVKKYEAAGYSLSKSVYDGIHRSLTSVGRFDEAEKIVQNMKNAGYKPDNITYSQLIFGLCKSRRLEEAYKVLDLMEADGCIPDLKTWTILIQGHCAADELDKALFYFAKMIEKNHDADADLLDILINGFLSRKRVTGAYKLLVEMVKTARLRPWQATYKNLIQKLLGERKLEEAVDLLRMMKNHNYPPFPEPFVQHISKFGTVEDAKEFLEALSIKKYPSISAYRHVFESFFQEGRHSEAKDLLYKCPHHIRQHKAICSLFGSANSGVAAA